MWECWAQCVFQLERARHSYEVEEDEEEAEESDAPASLLINGAAEKLVRHWRTGGVQLRGGSGTDKRHTIHYGHPVCGWRPLVL